MKLPCIYEARKDYSSGNTDLQLMNIVQTKLKQRRNSTTSVSNANSQATKLLSALKKVKKGVLARRKGNARKYLEL
jgi:hypothetical protein